MSAFVDSTLLLFGQDAFVTDLLTNGVGLLALFNASFQAIDFQPQSFSLGPLPARAYKTPAFEILRVKGTDERITPNSQRVQIFREWSRLGRIDWVDVSLDVILNAKVQTLIAPLQSVTITKLEQKLGSVSSLEDLRTKLSVLYAPSIVDAIFAKLNITTFADFEVQKHLFVEFVGAAPPAFDPNDPAATRSFTISLRVKIADGFDVAGALQAAKLCRSVLDTAATSQPPPGAEQPFPFVLITLFAAAAVTDTSIPGKNAAQAMTAVQALFANEGMFAQFIS
jgi:hypothetical protein